MRAARERGVGLVELMVWITVSLLLVTVIGTLYVNSKQLTRVNDDVSRLQENGRFAIFLLDHDMRMAGFRGCNGAVVTPVAVPSPAPPNDLNSNAYPYRFDISIVGYYGSGGAWTPALDPSISALVPPPLANTDVVTIRQTNGPGEALVATMLTSTDNVTVAPNSPLAAGDVLLLADCVNWAIFNATSFNSGTGVIAHEIGAGVPGNSTKDLGNVFGNTPSSNASVYRLVTKTYYVAPSVKRPGTNSMWVNSVPAYDGQPQPEELVEGIDNFSLLYGEALAGQRAANRYVTADAVTNWSNVVSVKAQLLLATVRDHVATSSQAYTFAGVTTTPTDTKIRTALSSVITLRNRVP